MKIHDLKPADGSRQQRKRVGRGIGGKGGKTAGRGTKGQKARSKVPVGFEGGQLPMHNRIPKLRGFNNPFRVEYQAINLDTISESGLDEVTPETLRSKGLVHKGALVKVLGRGELDPRRDGQGARLLRRRPRPPSPEPVARSRSSRSRSRCARPSHGSAHTNR